MKSILDYEHGMHRDIAEHIYHQRVLGLASKHALDLVRRSPAHYRDWIDGAQEESNDDLAFGKLVHVALLEPDRFAREFLVEPEWGSCRKNDADGTTTEQGRENKRRRDEWRTEHATATLVTAADHAVCRKMAGAIRKHPTAAKLFESDHVAEVTVRWRDEETGLECKMRTDLYIPELGVIVDLKSTRDASENGFIRDSSAFGYHRQDAFYREGMRAIGLPIEHFVFVAAEKKGPCAVGTYNHCERDLRRGLDSIREDLNMLAEAIETDNWKAYADGIVTVELREWAA